MKRGYFLLILFVFFGLSGWSQQDSSATPSTSGESQVEPEREAPLEFTPVLPQEEPESTPETETPETETIEPETEAPQEFTPLVPANEASESNSEPSEIESTNTNPTASPSLEEDEYVPEEIPLEDEVDFRPVISVSGGMLTFFGDVTNNQKTNGILTSNLAADLKVSFPLMGSFYVSLKTMYGKLSANERSAAYNRNFQSSLNTFGFEFSYNFNHFTNEKHPIDPFFAVGAEAVIFNSKTDLIYNATNENYHYWSDGTIKNLPEIPENYATATALRRDYNYETDIRESNISGVGFYEKYSFAIPVSAGANLRLTHRWHMRFGATYSFLFTDMVDGVSKDGKGIYQGNGKMEGLLYSHVGLSFDLSDHGRKAREEAKWAISIEELNAMALGDEDGDGVQNLDDECLGTPPEVAVDLKGCPPDTDQDGVPDYRDVEVNSLENAVVDSNGLALTDDQLEIIYLRFLDSTGTFAAIEDTIYAKDMPSETERRRYSKFSVQVAGEALTSGQANELLSEGKIKTVPEATGESILVGEFDKIEDAVAKNKELNEKGFKTRAIVEETVTGKVITADTRGVFVGSRSGKVLEKQDGTVFRIQVGAFRNPVKAGTFDDIKPVVGVKSSDGLTRYYSGNYSSFDAAAKARVQLKGEGYGDCMIKSFNAGDAVTLASVGAILADDKTATSPSQSKGSSSPNAGAKGVTFKIQLGSFREKIPMGIFNKYVKLGNITYEKDEGGMTRYFVGPFEGYDQAKAFRAELDELEIPGAFIVGQYQGKTISAKEALELSK